MLYIDTQNKAQPHFQYFISSFIRKRKNFLYIYNNCWLITFLI